MEQPFKADLKKRLTKDTAIIFRTTAEEKESIKKTAKAMHMSMTEYLGRLHQLALEQINQ